MAIQPDIALGVNTPQQNPLGGYLGMLKDLQTIENQKQQIEASKQQIAASKSSQALTEQQTANAAAENPGIAADAAVKKRAADFNQWQTDNAGQFVKPVLVQQTLPDGTPALDANGAPITKQAVDKNGNPVSTVDHQGFVNAAAKSGFYKEAQSIAATDLDNAAKGIKNATDQQDLAVKTAEFSNKQTSLVGSLLQHAPAEARPGLLQQYATYSDGLVPGSGKQVLATFGTTDPQTGALVVNGDKVKAVYDSTLSAKDTADIAIAKTNAATAATNAATSREAVVQSGVAGNVGLDSRTAPPSPDELAYARTNGFPVTPGMSRASLYALPGFTDAYKARVVSGSEKATAAQGATQAATDVARYGAAQSAVQKLIDRGLITGTSPVGTQLSNLASRFQNDPDVRAATSAVSGLNNPNINVNTTSADALKAQLLQEARSAQARADVASSVVKSTTYDQIPGAQKAAAQPTSPGAAVRMIDSKGKLYRIPANQVDAAMRDGLRRAQ